MTELTDRYDAFIFRANYKRIGSDEAIEDIGTMIDISYDLQKDDGLNHAILLSKKMFRRKLTSGQKAILHYYVANAWSCLRFLSKIKGKYRWKWGGSELEMEIYHYRSAINEPDFKILDNNRRCEILTNLANTYDFIGRYVEAIEIRKRVLSIDPDFTLAVGNKGGGLLYYGAALYDPGHQAMFSYFAYRDLKKALSLSPPTYAKDVYENYVQFLESNYPLDFYTEELEINTYSLGETKKEKSYRQWCLDNNLFLNPLNDLMPHSIAATDVFTLPSMLRSLEEGPIIYGMFNQLKQEYVSSRFLYFDSLRISNDHYSDREVKIYDLFDYTAYSLSIEKMKMAYRIQYSIFDKIALLLSAYFKLNIDPKHISFKSVWFVQKSIEIRPEINEIENWSLRGLFWLSKDLYEDKKGFKNHLEPDARELCKIRNRLEHRFVTIHEMLLPSDYNIDRKQIYQIPIQDFQNKTLRLIKLVRAALVYISLGIRIEEQKRNDNIVAPQIPLTEINNSK